MPQRTKQVKERAKVTPPHVSLWDLRAACGLTLDQVCDRMAEAGHSISRGGLSGIEKGHRGASRQVLAALEDAYGLRAGAITTSFVPRSRAPQQDAA